MTDDERARLRVVAGRLQTLAGNTRRIGRHGWPGRLADNMLAIALDLLRLTESGRPDPGPIRDGSTGPTGAGDV